MADLVGKKSTSSPFWQFFGFRPNDKGETADLTEVTCKCWPNILQVHHSAEFYTLGQKRFTCWCSLPETFRSFALWSRFSSRTCLYFAPVMVPLPVPAAEEHPYSMMMMLPPPCFMVGMCDEQCLVFSRDIVLCVQGRWLHLSHRTTEIISISVFHMPFCKLQVCCHVPFSSGVASISPLSHKAQIGEVP
jgi:hypothetical protein